MEGLIVATRLLIDVNIDADIYDISFGVAASPIAKRAERGQGYTIAYA